MVRKFQGPVEAKHLPILEFASQTDKSAATRPGEARVSDLRACNMDAGRAASGPDSIEALAAAELTAWFVRNRLADVALMHAGDDSKAAIALLERAIGEVAQLELSAN
jgi:hypothetical protein